MTPDIGLHEVFTTERDLDEVFAYTADFQRCEEWDPGVSSAKRLTLLPLGLGTEYRVVCKLGPARLPIHYTVIDWLQDEKVVLKGSCPFFEAVDTISFRKVAGATEVDYRAEFEFKKGVARFAGSMQSAFERMGERAVAGLARALRGDFVAAPASAGTKLADKLVLPGMARFSRAGYALAKSNWHPMSEYLDEKRFVITGATSGIGLASAERLAAMGAQLILVARNADKAAAAAEQIKRDTGNANIHVEVADLSIIAEVFALAERLLEKGLAIDALVNNAGALFNPRQLTAEGLEQSFALLLLSPYILTERLQPLLAAAGSARVVNVVSGGMYTQALDVHDIQNENDAYSGSVAYAKAKRALMVITEQWAEEWADDGIVVNAMHPGWADTPGVENALPGFHRVTKAILRTPAEGADTIVWLAAAKEALSRRGKLFLDREPHSTHLLAKTRSGDKDGAALRTILNDYMSSFQESGVAPVAPRA